MASVYAAIIPVIMSKDLSTTETQRKITELNELLRAKHLSMARAQALQDNVFGMARICIVAVADDFQIVSRRRVETVLGKVYLRQPIADLIPTAEARDYFEAFRRLVHDLPRLARECAEQPWRRVYPESPGDEIFQDWIPLPAGAWEVKAAGARVKADAKYVEFYFVSSRELIAPRDDFRVEYLGRTEAEMKTCDLSLVIGGGPVDIGPSGEFVGGRPDRNGYCFAFGAHNNIRTEIQRKEMAIVESRDVLIQPGRTHRCTAERIGGVLRFTVDGKEAFSCVDCVPLTGEGQGYVSFYTCIPLHAFSGLSVWTRASCLPPELWDVMRALERTVLAVPSGPSRHVEVRFLGRNADSGCYMFLFRDVSDAVKLRHDTGTRPA